MWRNFAIASITAVSMNPLLFANDLDHAPPAFGHRDLQAVPIDISKIDIDLEFDYLARKARAHAIVHFVTGQDGLPFLDVVPSPSNISLNEQPIDQSRFSVVNDPHGVTSFRVLNEPVEAGTPNVLEFDYVLSSNDVSFSSGRVRSGFFMSDLTSGGRSFFEQYGPANYEHDQFQLNMNVKVTGTSRDHTVYTNADVTGSDNEWSLVFPDFYTTSMPYFHITESDRFVERRSTYDGMNGTYPVLVYSSSSSLADSGMSRSLNVLRELEGTYGPSIHPKFVVYVTDGGGGMEYGGATMTSLGALTHEFTHFWFARGVMPSKANSGWIDEAVASWRGNGYNRANGGPNRSSVNLGGFSPYRRHTTRDAYSKGAQLMSEFDYLFRNQGGMRNVLAELFNVHKMKTITVGLFQTFIEDFTGQDMTPIFNRYVYGDVRNSFATPGPEMFAPKLRDSHPRPYTAEELARYR